MITLKTNTIVVINPRTLQEEFVYMNIKDVRYKGIKYIVDVNYYWIKEIPTGEVDENNIPVMRQQKIYLPKSEVEFTRSEATSIEIYSGGLAGSTFSDQFDALIVAGTMYQLTQTPVYGLSTTGWTLIP